MQNILPNAHRARYASTRGCEKSKCPSGVHANENAASISRRILVSRG